MECAAQKILRGCAGRGSWYNLHCMDIPGKRSVRAAYGWLTALILCLSACSTRPPGGGASSGRDPETVLVTYHVQPGKEAAVEDLVRQAWSVYRSKHLVFAHPHVIVLDKDEGGKPRIVEIFTWRSHDAPGQALATAKPIWDQMHALCESRGGHDGLEIAEVDLLNHKRK
jgi:hypothetical protein